MLVLEPYQRGRLDLQNRIIITSYAAHHGIYSPGYDISWYREHIRRRSRVGLFVLQCEFPRPVGLAPTHDAEHLTRVWDSLREAAHAGGAKLVLQLAHQGTHANGMANPTIRAIQGFSAVPGEISPEVAHEMSAAEIEALAEGFGVLAGIAHRAGLDGVELHGGHGHLIHQSISRWGNRRDDAWGEPLAFVSDVAARVRAEIGDGILGVRFPADERRTPDEGGTSTADLARLAATLTESRMFDYLNPTEGSAYSHYAHTVGTFRRSHGTFLGSTRAVRDAVADHTAIVGVGRIVTLDEAEAAVTSQACDLVAMTRAHIADPDIIAKHASGNADRVRRCVGANHCLDGAHHGRPLGCFQNPDVGREHLVRPPTPSGPSRHVLVIGAGPAGLKASETAARAGHRVTLVDEQTMVGGRLASLTRASESGELLDVIDWLGEEITALGVDLRLGTLVDADFVANVRPDQVIVATGSAPAEHRIPTDSTIPLLSTDQALDRAATALLGKVLVIDEAGTEEVRVTWEQLRDLGNDVTIVSPHATIGRYLGHTHLVDLIPDALRRGCRVRERTAALRITSGSVEMHDLLSGQHDRDAVDAVILGSYRRANDTLAHELADRFGPVHVIGDAYAPRNATIAIREGDDAGRTL